MACLADRAEGAGMRESSHQRCSCGLRGAALGALIKWPMCMSWLSRLHSIVLQLPTHLDGHFLVSLCKHGANGTTCGDAHTFDEHVSGRFAGLAA
jgi:hypothetical protein